MTEIHQKVNLNISMAIGTISEIFLRFKSLSIYALFESYFWSVLARVTYVFEPTMRSQSFKKGLKSAHVSTMKIIHWKLIKNQKYWKMPTQIPPETFSKKICCARVSLKTMIQKIFFHIKMSQFSKQTFINGLEEVRWELKRMCKRYRISSRD